MHRKSSSDKYILRNVKRVPYVYLLRSVQVGMLVMNDFRS